MNKVPIVHVTEVLAQAFGIITVSVRRLPAEFAVPASAFDVVDSGGRQWRLHARRVASATRNGLASAHRWGLQWTLQACTHGLQDDLPTIACADGILLERVGCWLQQPAGLPAATDIPGQGFLDAWHGHRERIAGWHARAEALHDALERHAVEPADGSVDVQGCGVPCRQPHPARTAWHRHRGFLQQLVECQALLLGAQAATTPASVRLQALRRLFDALEALTTPHVPGDAWSRAG